MQAEWYYAKNKQKAGPVTEAQLKELVHSGELSRTDMVWKQGMAKWMQASQVRGLFVNVPSEAVRPSAPPPLPSHTDVEPASIPVPPKELKGPVIGMLIVTTLGLGFGLLGLLFADTRFSVMRTILYAIAFGHNLISLFAIYQIVQLRRYTMASLAPFLVMPSWFWFLLIAFHGVPLMGLILGIAVGVWSLLILKRDDVKRAFDADPPLPPLISLKGFGKAPATHYTLDPATRFPWATSEREKPNPKLKFGTWGVIGAGIVALLLFFTDAAILGLWLLGVVFLFSVFWVRVLWGLTLRGRWLPVDGQLGWVEFLPGNIFKKEDGTVASYVLLPNQHFIDILVSGQLVDSWKVLARGDNSLEIQDMAGKVRSFKKGKTLEEKQMSFFSEDRSRLLQRKWEPVNGDDPAIQFTEDGAMIRFDGFAARYTFSGEEPNEVITIHIDNKNRVLLKVLSLNGDEMVLTGEGGTCHYRRGVSVTDAAAQQRADAAKERMKAIGKAALLTVGAIGAGIAVLGVAAAATGAAGGGGYSGGAASGSDPNSGLVRCTACGGQGVNRHTQEGRIVEYRCGVCDGKGWK